MPRRLPHLVLPLLLAAGLGGCADGDVEEANAYVGAVNRAQERFTADSTRLLAELAPEDPVRVRRAVLGRINGAVDGFVGDLRAIDPPARVDAQHERLIAAGERFGDELRRAGAAMTSDDASRVLDGQERLAAAGPAMSRSVNGAIAEINAELEG